MKNAYSFLAGAGCALLLAVGGVSTARAEEAPKPRPAIVPGMMQLQFRDGPWGYGCFYPARQSSQTNTMCTIGRALKESKNPSEAIAGGLFMLVRNTPDSKAQPLAGKPWNLNLLLPNGIQQLNLAQPMTLTVDGKASVTLSWVQCKTGMCGASAQPLPADVTQALAHGGEARLVALKKDGSSWSQTFPLAVVNKAMGQIDGWVAKGTLTP